MNHTLVCLHGWGGSEESFTELRNSLKDSGIRVLAPDLPGFGNEAEPQEPWNTDRFANWVTKYIRENVQGPYALLGHSHGGRIAIKLVSRICENNEDIPAPTHLFLCAAAGIKHPKHMKRIIGLTLAKAGKSLLSMPGLRSLQTTGKQLLYKLFGVHDYEKASEVMRKTLILVSQEDLSPLLETITVPTSIFWGENDTMTPISDGKLMQKHIKGSTFTVFPDIRHRVHRDKADAIGKSIITTLQ